MDYQFPVRLDVYGVDEYHSFVTSGFGASMIDTVEAVVNIDEHTMPLYSTSDTRTSAISAFFVSALTVFAVEDTALFKLSFPIGIIFPSEKVCRVQHIVKIFVLHDIRTFCPASVDFM